MNNIYIALSAHHVMYCESISKINTSHNNILITLEGIKFDKSIFNSVIFVGHSVYNQSNSKVEKIKNIFYKIKSYKKVVNKLKHLKNNKNITVYFSSLEDVLSNYLLLNFSKDTQGVVFEDGMLNYYEHTINDVSAINFKLKKIIALLHGLSYTNYKGHTSGIDYDRVKYQLVRVPELSIRPNKSKTLPLVKYNSFKLNDDILIVGQEPYGNIYGKDFYLEKIKQLIDLIKLDSEFTENKQIFYKPHRHGPRIKASFLDNNFKNTVTYIEDNISIENIYFNKIRCKNIYTIDSSAVFSIFQDAPQDVRNQLKISVMPFKKSTLTLLFSKLNFINLKNDI
ncbi:hypothetical protein [Algibacter sp. PT7-4]|uniref:hypothetical protein n=1 Tax=Algibacter ulvanivorans TaxID=3400999 RepID=UPI003AAA3700